MKMKTTEAARQLGIHPAHLFQHIAGISSGLRFDDVWPQIDEDWVRCIATVHPPKSPEPGQVAVLPTPDGAIEEGFSDLAIRVLDKLVRQRKWGNASVTFEALRNLAHLSNREVDRVVAELKRRDLLDHDGTGRSTISLNPARRSAIESLVESRRAHAARAS